MGAIICMYNLSASRTLVVVVLLYAMRKYNVRRIKLQHINSDYVPIYT